MNPLVLAIDRARSSSGLRVIPEAPITLRDVDVGRQKWVVIVDDDRDILELLTDILEGAGYLVQTAPNGQAALDLLFGEYHARDINGQHPLVPDLLILDLMMPVMSGAKLYAKLLSMPQFRALCEWHTVVVSAHGNLDGYGWVLSLAKPLDVDVLLATVAREISRTE